ncbi:MAG: GspH/FimT family pseudopilin [Deltaproteobacteria bacterium]
MPIAATSQARTNRSRSAGFTLVEIIVVMVIIAVAAMVVMPSVRSGTEQRQLRSCLQQMVSAVRYSSSTSVMERRRVSIGVDPDQSSYQVEGGSDGASTVSLPRFASFGDLSGGRYDEDGQRVMFDFYPTGASSGGSMELLFDVRGGRRSYRLTIDPLISRVLLEELE